MSVELWLSDSHSMNSDIFTVPPGKVCVLCAANLAKEKVRVTNAEFKTCQSVCVYRIVHTADAVLEQRGSFCNWVVAAVDVSKVVDEILYTNGCCWELNNANNLRIIGVPGTYRLRLNDATAIGVAQVYADLYDVEQIPNQVSHLFF